ncbi:MAG: DMT family transporter [Desulfobacterales bacterium]|nr:DMT family transporter [Desulfobacterales bacterium]
MKGLHSYLLFVFGIIAGGMIAVQSVLNATLGERIGNFGSVLVVTLVSVAILIPIICVFPQTARFGALPGLSEWYLYTGGALGVLILAAPILLVPYIGTTSTLVAIVMGQLLIALMIDHFGLFASPRITASLPRLFGIVLVAIGAIFVTR